MREYQPIVKNLKNMALRNRNLLVGVDGKLKIPVVNGKDINFFNRGVATEPVSPQCPKSPMNKQFYYKYLNETEGNKPEHRAVSRTYRNQVKAHKDEQ